MDYLGDLAFCVEGLVSLVKALGHCGWGLGDKEPRGGGVRGSSMMVLLVICWDRYSFQVCERSWKGI